MFVEECVRGIEPLSKQSPQSFATYFASLTCESGNKPFWMLFGWRPNRCFDFKPIANCRDLAERYPGLDHTERAGIHSQKDDALPVVTVLSQVSFMRFPGIIERVVDVGDGTSKTE